MFDKVLHFLGGVILSIPSNQTILIGVLSGVGVEILELVLHFGSFDPRDIIATGLGGIAIHLWKTRANSEFR